MWKPPSTFVLKLEYRNRLIVKLYYVDQILSKTNFSCLPFIGQNRDHSSKKTLQFLFFLTKVLHGG